MGDNTLLAMPTLLAQIVPPGLMGLTIAAMLAADMSTDSSYMLTWGSVIYNDILGPFRKSTSEKRGLLINRMIVALIGVFLLIYGLWYKIEGDLWTYLGITGTIYLSSMSVLLISCCYWPREQLGRGGGHLLRCRLAHLHPGATEGRPVHKLVQGPRHRLRHCDLRPGGRGDDRRLAAQALRPPRPRSTGVHIMIQGIQSMLSHHGFWGGLTLAVLVWYSTTTVYVAVRGVVDIRQMLRRLASRPTAENHRPPPG